ncbi:polynucleotide kinase-phosphatase [Marinactinospora endophytica]
MTPERELVVPAKGLVVLVGVSGSGKSTFAARNFAPTQVVGSDSCRGMVSDDENDQSATADAFGLLHHLVDTRLRRGLLTVVDATNVDSSARKRLLRIAADNDLPAVAVVLDPPEQLVRDRGAARADRALPDSALSRQYRQMRNGLEGEGFHEIHVLRDPQEIDSVVVRTRPLDNDQRARTGPFDIIGDVHGCRAELEELLTRLGYTLERDGSGRAVGARHAEGRTAVFVGDLVDRGPDTPGVLRLVMGMVESGDALCTRGNHEDKLLRALKGGKVKVAHGLAATLEQLSAEPEEFRDRVLSFCAGLVDHYMLDGGRLVVAHAGLKEAYHGRSSGRVRAFALYGQVTGETDEYGLPVRHPWAEDYRGAAAVVYGHVPTDRARWVNNTICLDTGCVFGGRLTALRYPERRLVDVPARRVWSPPVRPLGADDAPAPRDPELLDIGDVLAGPETPGGTLDTAHGPVRVPAGHVLAALEAASWSTVDPRWLIYLPPPAVTVPASPDPMFPERPDEAFDHYREQGIDVVICQESRKGTRAVAIVCRDSAAAARRFVPGEPGTVYTRRGEPFFPDPVVEAAVLAELRAGIEAAGLWEELDTDWVALDGEFLPWSLRAGAEIRHHASAGVVARATLPAAAEALAAAAARGVDVEALADRVRQRAAAVESYSAAYRRHVWPTDGTAGLCYALFAVLAVEGNALTDRDHLWHMGVVERLAEHSGRVRAPRYLAVDLVDPRAVASATAWWRDLVTTGGAGMVVKPLAGALAEGRKGLVQPGLEVRGPDDLLLDRGLDPSPPAPPGTARRRGLGRAAGPALMGHRLGVEALARHAAGEPLWRVHPLVFAALALQSRSAGPEPS